MPDLDGLAFCPTGSAQRYHRIGECECPPRFSLSPEATVHCEWHTFTAGAERCEARSTQVILDREDQDDHQYPAGFHFAHLCDKHAQPALAFALAHPDEP